MTDTSTPTETVDASTQYGVPYTQSHGQDVLHPTREQYLGLVAGLKADGFNVLIDVTAVDYLAHPQRAVADGITAERYEVVTNFLSHAQRRRIRMRVQVPASDATMPSLFELFPGSEAMEREVFDLMGVVFSNHPDLTRILMPEDWEGHSLQKDYSQGRVPVQFKYPEGVYTEADTVRTAGEVTSAGDLS